MKGFLIFVAFAMTTALVGCGDEERSNLFEAQVCIDKIQVDTSSDLPGDVDVCLAKISSATSANAYVLRCSGDFIRQGIAEDQIVAAIQDLDKKNATTDPTATTLTNLSFGTTAEDVTAAETAFENCSASESETLTALAGLARISTVMDSLTGGASIEDFITNFDPNTDMTDTEKVQLADSIIDSKDALCDKDSGLAKDSEVCDNIDTAAAESSALTDAEKAEFINAYMESLKTPDN